MTPLIDGWELSRINLDPNQEPEGEDKWAWYYYPEGIVGEEVKDRFWIRARKEGRWKDGVKPMVPFWMQMGEKKLTMFEWSEEERQVKFTEGKIVELSEDEKYAVSGDGRYAIIFQGMPTRERDQKALQRLLIIEGKDGEIRKSKIESDFYEGVTEAYWLGSGVSSGRVGGRPR
ncbi:MAG: hypothetical protein ACJAVK_001908 [Akkermansiaceae bacterium]